LEIRRQVIAEPGIHEDDFQPDPGSAGMAAPAHLSAVIAIVERVSGLRNGTAERPVQGSLAPDLPHDFRGGAAADRVDFLAAANLRLRHGRSRGKQDKSGTDPWR